MDTFVLERIAEDERHARADYNRDLSQERLEWVLDTCRARRQLVTMYRETRETRETQEAHAAYGLCLAVVAELYSDHPDYDTGWRPTRFVPAARLS
jgi:hypothetical protein